MSILIEPVISITFWTGIYITKSLLIGIYNTGKYLIGIKSEQEIMNERIRSIENTLKLLHESNLNNKELCKKYG